MYHLLMPSFKFTKHNSRKEKITLLCRLIQRKATLLAGVSTQIYATRTIDAFPSLIHRLSIKKSDY